MTVIARVMQWPSAELWDQLREACADGRLVELPRESHSPLERLTRMPQKSLINLIIGVFRITRGQARILLALMQRHSVAKEHLLDIYNHGRDRDTGIEILGVQISSIRKHFRKAGIPLAIETIWGEGYRLPTADRRRAWDMVLAMLNEGEMVLD